MDSVYAVQDIVTKIHVFQAVLSSIFLVTANVFYNVLIIVIYVMEINVLSVLMEHY